jgi:hypothetical protein
VKPGPIFPKPGNRQPDDSSLLLGDKRQRFIERVEFLFNCGNELTLG